MGERTSYAPGTFCWQELSTTDSAGAKSFYGSLFGWEADDQPLPGGGSYTMLRIGDQHVGALYEQGPEQRAAEIPPHWASYVSVTDVDDTGRRAVELGAELVAEPFDVMEAGRMAILRDPVGAMVSLWEPRRHIGAGLVNEPSTFCWNELGCTDPERASEFYGQLLGWSFQTDSDTGYRTASNADGVAAGIRALTEAEAGMPAAWMACVAVEGIDATMSAAEETGGRTLAPTRDIAIGRFGVLADPQGAVLAVFEGQTNP